MIAAVELLAGLVYLLLGGDLLVRGAVSLADRWGLSPMLVGVTIVAVGTSAPELVVSVRAALTGHPGIALGNVVGSNIANMLLVIGALAIVCMVGSQDVGSRSVAKAMLMATLILVALAWDGNLTRVDGILMLSGLPFFLAARIRQVQRGGDESAARRDGRIEWVLGHPSRTWMILTFLVLGGICLPIGADLLVVAAQSLALGLGVEEAVVASTIVAAGTSLPELATVLVAAARRQVDVALGNALGSNVFNIIAVMGVATAVSPAAIPIPDTYRWLDLPLMTASGLIVAYFALRSIPVRRAVGWGLVATYAAYVLSLYVLGPRV